MTNLKKSLIFVACIVALLTTLFAFSSCGGNEISTSQDLELGLNEETDTYEITGVGACTDTDIIIPSTYNEKPVTSIGNFAFRDCTSLTSITISDSVTYIGSSAFRDCTSLTSITISDSVASIGSSAFRGCTGLTSVTISDSVTSIGNYAFSGCTSLTSITIPDSVTSIGHQAFYGCPIKNAIIPTNAISHIPNSDLKTVVINGGTSIGYEAFYNCKGLTSITIPDSVTYIGYYAFRDCTNLTIYCEAESEPSGWISSWNSSGCPVVWGHAHAYENGTCICGKSEN